MIIRRLVSDNILRYRHLEVSGLPAHGRILIAGPNESGKSAILETLCLALFGRTTTFSGEAVARAVKWGAESGSLTLEFTACDGVVHTLHRHLEAGGTQLARLDRADREEPVAQGVEAVNQAVVQTLGFDFTQFASAIYYTHGRHGHPNPGETVKELAGVALLERLGATLGTEIDATGAAIDLRRTQQATAREEIVALDLREEALDQLQNRLEATRREAEGSASAIERWEGFDVAMVHSAKSIDAATRRVVSTSFETGVIGWQSRCDQLDQGIRELETICHGGHVEMDDTPAEGLRAWLARWQGRLNGLHGVLETVAAEEERLARWLGRGEASAGDPSGQGCRAESAALDLALKQLTRRRRFRGWSALLLLMLALPLWIAAGVTSQPPHPYSQPLLELLARHLPLPESVRLILLMAGAAVATLLLLWNLIGRWRAGRGIAANRKAREVLEAQIRHGESTLGAIREAANRSLEHQVEQLVGLPGVPWSGELQNWTQGEGRPLLHEETLRTHLAEADRLLNTFQADHAACREEAGEQLQAARREHADHLTLIASLEIEVAREVERRRENARLHALIATLEEQIRRDDHAILVRRAALEQLKPTALALSNHFIQELHRFISRTAPLFTQGRYRHLRIDDGLNVEVFSVDKNDFVPMDEISTGVRRQLNLAVRMALAHALATRAGGRHALLLDEPFAYFDRQRCRESLDALLRISEKITQVWIAGQEFDDNAFASGLCIPCAVEQDLLVLNAQVTR